MAETDIQSRVKRAVQDRDSLEGMRKSFRTIVERQKENTGRIPDLDQRKDWLRKTKESSVENAGLFSQAVAVLRENGFRVIVAESAEAAIKAVQDELEGCDLVVKSKSNLTKELHLAERLEAAGTNAIETDLGDRIVQLAGCAPTHPTGPACHLTRSQIASLFTEHFKKRVSEDPAELTRVMRDEIASYLSKARVGVTGANAVTASEGAVVIVHNEGNAAKCAMLPDKHIIVTTPDKVVPSLEDAMNIAKLQTFFSTGKVISSYVNIVTGPSYTADIEKEVYRGMHGPREVVIIFVDDGRLRASDKEPQYCIGCGTCLLYCPTYAVIGPVFGSLGHMGGQGVYLAGSLAEFDEAFEGGLYLCTSCGACAEVCPSKVDIKKGIINTRRTSRNLKKGMLPEHDAVVASVRNYDNPWQVPRRQKSKWSDGLGLKRRGEVVFFAGCSTSLLFGDNARRAVELMRACGIEPAYLGQDEKCCGSTVRKLGEEALAREKAEKCYGDFKSAGAKLVVTSCPGCSSALNHYKDLPGRHGITVQHVSQFLAERLETSKLHQLKDTGRVTFHDPCDLGREQGVYEEPRTLLAAAIDGRIVEMERSRNNGACCGSGSGVKSAFPDLASAIAWDRIEMAKSVGARVLVTSCPWCVQSLRECQGADQCVQVLDLVEVLERSLLGGR
ncbi:MAG: LUD domain-containing protein [Thermoplasmata archaeon]